jgi:lipoate synthase
MSKLALDMLEAGMRLAKPVENSSGMVLLGENTELTVELIEKIKDMGIDSVYIQGMSKPSVPIEVMLSELDERFKRVENEPYMDVLKKAFKEHIERLYE